MAVIVKIVNGIYRITEEGTGNVAMSKNGKPMDGGGHSEMWKAIRQATHINVATEQPSQWSKSFTVKK